MPYLSLLFCAFGIVIARSMNNSKVTELNSYYIFKFLITLLLLIEKYLNLKTLAMFLKLGKIILIYYLLP